MIAFLEKSKAGQECAGRCVLRLRHCGQASALKLHERVAQHRPHGALAGPSASGCDERDLDIRRTVISVDRGGDDLVGAYNTDCCAWAEIGDAEAGASPPGERFIVTEQEHGAAD